jgi:hypothetical protein
MKQLFTIISVVVLALAASSALLAQKDAHMGTWKLNVAKSKFDPGPPLKSETRTYESTGNGYKLSGKSVTADGSAHTTEFTVTYDGKDHPMRGDTNGADSLAVKLVDANHLDSVLKKGGKTLYTSTVIVSQDGEVMTITSKGKNGSGQSFTNVLVYDKQ